MTTLSQISRNVEQVLGRVQKANVGKTIFNGGRFYGTALHCEDRFQLWFRKFNGQGYGYAESADGIQFKKKADLTGINFAGDFNLAVELNRAGVARSRRYVGGNERHGTDELDPPVWFEKRQAIGLATLPIDRIVGWHAGPRQGIIRT